MCAKGILLRMFLCYTKCKHCRKGGRISPPKWGIRMETYEFFTFLVVFTVLIMSVKR